MAGERVEITFLGEAEGAKRAASQTVGAIRSVEHQSQRSTGAMKRHAEESVAANALLTGSFNRMASRAVAAGAAFTALYIGISKGKAAIQSTVELAHQTELLHRNLGLAVKTASGLEAVLKARGIDAAGAAMAFQTLSRQVLSAETGSKKTQAAFSALGITAKDLKTAHGDLNVLLPKIAEGFGNIKGGADRAAVAQALLGRGYRTLVPLFAEGKKGFDDQIRSAQQFGAVLDEHTLRQLDRLHAAQIKNKEAALGLQIAFTEAATPALLNLSKLTQRLAKDFQGPGSLDDKMGRVGKDLGPALAAVEHTLEAAIPKIANHVGKDAPKVAKAFVDGFIEADVWGKLALGVFILRATGGWRPLLARAGTIQGAAYAGAFIKGAAAGLAGWEIGTELYNKVPEVRHAADAIAQVLTDALHPHISIDLNPTNPHFRIWFGNAKVNDSDANAKTDAQMLRNATPKQLQRIIDNAGAGTPSPMPPGGGDKTAYHGLANSIASHYGIAPGLLWGVFGKETGYGSNDSTSSAGAKGAFQFMPGTAKTYGYPMTNALNTNVFIKQADAAARYLRDLLKRFHGDEGKALNAYSGGGYDSVSGGGAKTYEQYLAATTGPKAKKAKPVDAGLAWARQMVGHFKETTGQNTGPELDALEKEFGTHAAAWCAEFATKALVKAGFPKGVMTASVQAINVMAQQKSYGLHFTASPRPGDLVTFGSDHVAIVDKVNRSKGTVETIAGNSGQGDVARATYKLGQGRYIAANPAGASVGMPTPRAPVPAFDMQAFAQAVVAPLLARSQGVLSGRDDRATAFGQLLRSAGIDAGSAQGLGLAGRDLTRRLQSDKQSLAPLQTALKDALALGQHDLAATIRSAIHDVNSDIAETLTQISENTRDTAKAVQDAAISARANTLSLAMAGTQRLFDNASFAQSVIGFGKGGGDQNLAASNQALLGQYLPQFAGLTGGGLADYVKGTILPQLQRDLKLPGADTLSIDNQILQALGIISDATQQTAQNTQDLSEFWKQDALQALSAFRISQSQYGVLKGTSSASLPFLGGFDAGGTVPGPRGMAGLALVHGGETVLPTHKGGQAPVVNVYVHPDASARGITASVDQDIGRRRRQFSVAPGGG